MGWPWQAPATTTPKSQGADPPPTQPSMRPPLTQSNANKQTHDQARNLLNDDQTLETLAAQLAQARASETHSLFDHTHAHMLKTIHDISKRVITRIEHRKAAMDYATSLENVTKRSAKKLADSDSANKVSSAALQAINVVYPAYVQAHIPGEWCSKIYVLKPDLTLCVRFSLRYDDARETHDLSLIVRGHTFAHVI